MEKFRKLTREDMKNLSGGENLPSCTNSCVYDSDCSSGKKCKEVACPNDPDFTHIICTD